MYFFIFFQKPFEDATYSLKVGELSEYLLTSRLTLLIFYCFITIVLIFFFAKDMVTVLYYHSRVSEIK